jgi:hypothetical protein
MTQIDLAHKFSPEDAALIDALAHALLMNMMQIDQWLLITNAVAAATAETLLNFDITDAVRLEMVDQLAQGIRANLMMNSEGMTKQ